MPCVRVRRLFKRTPLLGQNLQNDPDFDHRVAHNEGSNDPVCAAILIELG